MHPRVLLRRPEPRRCFQRAAEGQEAEGRRVQRVAGGSEVQLGGTAEGKARTRLERSNIRQDLKPAERREKDKDICRR